MTTRFWLLILICIYLTGCGFHLRGAMPLPPSLCRVYLKTCDPFGQLTKNLKQYLVTSGVQLIPCPDHETPILEILREDMGQELINVSSTQLTRQYNLTLTVSFQITTAAGLALTPPQIVSEVRTITMQSSQMLGGSNAAYLLYQQMRQAIVFDIMNRLSSIEISCMLTNHPL